MPSPTIAGFPALTREGRPSGAALGEGTLSLRVVVRTPTVETFVQRYSRYVKDDRIFIFTKSEQPPGTRLRFTLELIDGRPLVAGEGTVTRVRGDTGDPTRPPGMELAFIPTDEASRKIVQLMLDERLARGPKTASLTAPPVPPPAQLPALPQTGAFEAVDRLAASPLLRGAIAGQHNDLPARPGTLRPPHKPEPFASKTHAVVAPPIPSIARSTPMLGGAKVEPALRETKPLAPVAIEPVPLTLATLAGPDPIVVAPPAFEAAPSAVEAASDEAGVDIDVPAEPEPSAPPVSSVSRLTESTVAALFDIGPPPAALDWNLPTEVSTPRAEPSVIANELEPPSSSRLDPGSLFASEDGNPPATTIDHTPLPVPSPPRVDQHDDLSQSFPGLAVAPAFAEGWRSTEGDPDAVPANPFGEVSDNAIEYFVEWSLERSTGAATTTDRAPAAFGTIAMKPPEPDAPPDRGMRFGLAVGLAAGLAIGAIVGGTTAWIAKPYGRPQPVVAVAPIAAVPSAAAPIAAPAKIAAAPVPPPAKIAPAPVAAPVKVAAAPLAAPVKVTAPAAVKAPPGASTSFAIQSHPPGASVTVDGKPEGKTPLALQLAAGPHDVRLSLERYVEYEATVDSPGNLDAQLHRPRATLKITSSPSGADVVVGGAAHGKTPAVVVLPAYESYTVKVSLNGRDWTRKLYLKAPSTSVQATLASRGLPTRAMGRDVRSAGIR